MQKLCCVCTRQQFSASLDYFVTSSPSYFHQFSTISGGNCIRFCDTRCRFTYISVQHPASASDYLSFVTSSLYQQLMEGSGLPNRYCLYGDNAYISKTFMSVPFPNMSSGPRDAYNYYQSQLRINIECAFGVLTNCWHLLKSPLSARIPINRINALISCL